MPHTIEVAKTGRATCRTCREKIDKDQLRFGEEVMNAFAEGTTYNWHHLTCAAKKKAGELKAALDAHTGAIPNRAEIDELMKDGLEKLSHTPTELPYAERAPTGRSRCLACEQPIDKGTYRVAVERDVDAGGFMRKGAGYYHAACGKQAVAGGDLAGVIRKNSKGLSVHEIDEVLGQMR